MSGSNNAPRAPNPSKAPATVPVGVRGKLEAERRRQRNLVAGKLAQGEELLPLLMKRRNGGVWSRSERALLLRRLRRLATISPYLMPLRLPGAALLVPFYAWWLDHRKKQRR